MTLKAKFVFSFLFHILSTGALFAQNDSLQTRKSGVGWAFIPALSYDTDLGIKYGGVVNIFDFGNGKDYPNYKQFLQVKITNTTKKSSQIQALLESEKIIKNANTFVEAGFWRDIKFDFFGFNGQKTQYNSQYTNNESTQFINPLFYSHQRQYFRARFDVQKYLSQKEKRILIGISYNNFNLQLQENKDKVPEIDNLFYKYTQWGVLPESEQKGGSSIRLKMGYIYDTRNDKCYCTNGSWFEGFLMYSQGLNGIKSYLKSVITYRFYKDLIPNKRLSITLRLSTQNKLWGTIPFYELPVYLDTRLNQDGVGGAFTLRGILRNRIAADGFMLSNNEIKLKLFSINLFKQDFVIYSSVFTDFSYVMQEYNINLDNVISSDFLNFFTQNKQQISASFGPGIYIVFNKTSAITLNYGYTPNAQLGKQGIYVGSSLLF